MDNIKTQILQRYAALATDKDRLEYLYELQERMRLHHNAQAARVTTGEITLEEFRAFQKEFDKVNQVVAEHLAPLRETVFEDEYKVKKPADKDDEVGMVKWNAKKEELKKGTRFSAEIEILWP